MDANFLFSKEHLAIMLFFSIYISVCPQFTKNLLPYSYIVEKIICGLLILEIVFEQVSLMSMGVYNSLTSLPINTSRFCAYLCICILIFKKFHLFNVFFSWSLVCSIGEIIFFKEMPFDFPNILYFLFIFSKMLLFYAHVYMLEVRKFKVSLGAIKQNLIMCVVFFSLLFFLNNLTHSSYDYSFSNFNLSGIAIFMFITSLTYIPFYICDKFNFRLKK